MIEIKIILPTRLQLITIITSIFLKIVLVISLTILVGVETTLIQTKRILDINQPDKGIETEIITC